jgi:hypothetical protein
MEQYKIEKGIFTADDISAMLKNCFPFKKAIEKSSQSINLLYRRSSSAIPRQS